MSDNIFSSSEWDLPIFKLLANNDTGSAPGHQGGVVIPEALRHYFPSLSGSATAQRPTIDQRIHAELFCENNYLATVSTRYQHQTWGGARSPESRLTDQLGPLRNLAKGGDILVIQRHTSNSLKYKLNLFRKTSSEFKIISALTDNKRWGWLGKIPTQSVDESLDGSQSVERDDLIEDEFSAKKLDVDILPFWAAAAYVARCARRFLECYEGDNAEPSAQRATAAQAVMLAESRATIGGAAGDLKTMEFEGQYFDNYDIVAMQNSLLASEQAAENTYADLHDDRDIERSLARILTAISLSRLALDCAFADETEGDAVEPLLSVQLAIDWALWGEPSINNSLVDDFDTLVNFVKLNIVADQDAVSAEVFGELWPDGRPPSWPPLKLSFRPRARIIRTIGDRLISGPEAAVIELVKNSYDADASFVQITFLPLTSGQISIAFEDDGHGMTLEDIQQKWMEPATSDKRDKKETKKGRRLLGSKGIGRFAVSRLGRFLELTSTAHKTPEKLITSISNNKLVTTRISKLDWDEFENVKYLDDVSFPVESLAPYDKTGTILKISDLRDEWTSQAILKLHSELRKIVSPVRSSKSSDFRIFLNLAECKIENSGFDGFSLLKVNGNNSISNFLSYDERFEVLPYPLLDACDYAVDGVFDENGHFDGTMTIQRGGLEPEGISMHIPAQLHSGHESCGIVLVKLHIFDREANAIRSTAAKAGFGQIGIREARKQLDNIAGVAIYRGGFRIRPYGDGENDWLMLDTKRVQNPTLRIGRNQISGIITVDDENESNLIERSSREGLEENGSFHRLKWMISTLLSEVVEPKRRHFRINAGLDARPENSFKDIYERVQLDWSKILVAKMPEADRPAAEEMIAKESDRLAQYVKRLQDRQAQLEARVTLGLIVGEVMHQGNTPLSFLENECSRLGRWWPTLWDESEKSRKRILEVPRVLNGMGASGKKLRALFDALNPLSGARRGAPESYLVTQVIEENLYIFKSRIEKNGVEINLEDYSAGRLVIGYSDDLSTAITNLFDNSLYWMEYHNIFDPKISIIIKQDEKKCDIVISDNGVGVPLEFSEQLFDIGFTLKPNGTGLGLSIAKEAVFRSSGELELLASDVGAAFKIILPFEQIN